MSHWAGIDGPATFLSPEASDLGPKVQILSVGQPQTVQEEEPEHDAEPERDGDTEQLLEPKTDLHEMLQRQGEESGTRDSTTGT